MRIIINILTVIGILLIVIGIISPTLSAKTIDNNKLNYTLIIDENTGDATIKTHYSNIKQLSNGDLIIYN